MGYAVPIYYVLTVLLVAGAAVPMLAFKRQWSKWELLWWALPVICLPGILHSNDPLWSLRQWLSWAVRGLIPGGIIFLTAHRKKTNPMLLCWIYPVIIAASLLGLTELLCEYNPLRYSFSSPILATSQPANPFYRPGAIMRGSAAPQGTQGNRIPYASTIVCFLPLGLWLLKYKKRFHLTHFLAVGVLFSILLLAQVRAVWVGALVAMLLMHVVGLHRNRREAAKIIAGVLLCLGVFLSWPKTRNILWPRFNSFHLTQLSISARMDVLETARVLKDQWFAGVGFGQFPVACKPYYHGKIPWFDTPDNQYLRWTIENGVLSFALLLTFFIGLVRAGWKKILLMEDVQHADFYKSVLVGWLSIAVTFLFFDGFYWGACNMTFWCFLGLFARCLESSESEIAYNGGHRSPLTLKNCIITASIQMPRLLRRSVVIFLDFLVIAGAYIAAFQFRFGPTLQSGSPNVLNTIFHTLPFISATFFVAAIAFSLYRGIYYFCSIGDIIVIAKVVASSAVVGALVILFLRQGQFPRSILLLNPVLAFLGLCAVRIGIRWVKNRWQAKNFSIGDTRAVLIVGAGDMGESLLRQMLKTARPRYHVVGFIDDDPAKKGRHIHGHTIFGGRHVLIDVLKRSHVDEIVIAIANRRGEILRSVMDLLGLSEQRPELKIAPTVQEMLAGKNSSIRKVNPVDLLNRDIIRLDKPLIARTLERKIVLVTGAGGTIGSELCLQALKYGPEKIILLENHATSLFYREQELKEKSKGAAIVSVLGDIRDQGLVERVFKLHRPQVVLHAAAHKHLHQLEFNIQEGVSNNVVGTHHMAAAAAKHGAAVFLLVSTDKAVRPTSVMGATKRAAECIVKHYAAQSNTRFIGVRFGNVLGSSGSVLRIFQEQIANGGPVTVTNPDVRRYFMTVEESVELILQAVAMAKGGEIFVLKMGTPVRILDMAKNLILLSGLEPDKDIEIRITGLRQGEKLDEELVEDISSVQKSEHPDIMVLKSERESAPDVEARVLEMEIASRGMDLAALLRQLQEFVPTFQPAQSLPALAPNKTEEAI